MLYTIIQNILIPAVVIGTIGALLFGALIVRLATAKPDGIDRTSRAYKMDGRDVHLSKPAGYVTPKGGR